MPQSNVADGPQHGRNRRKLAFGWFGMICLLLGASCWILSRARTAVVVTIDDIGVDSKGVVTVSWSPEARRDANIVQGCANVADPDVRMPEPLQHPVHGLGLVERWQ